MPFYSRRYVERITARADHWAAEATRYRAERDDLTAKLRHNAARDTSTMNARLHLESRVIIAERERDEARAERDRWEGEAEKSDIALERRTRERDEARAERDALKAKLHAPDNRPTLDPEAVEAAVLSGSVSGGWDGATQRVIVGRVVGAIMALVPAVEGWPEWLGPKIDPDDFQVTRDGDNYRVNGDLRRCLDAEDARLTAALQIGAAAKWEAVARFIEAEQAATGDEDQRVDDLFAEVTNHAAIDEWHPNTVQDLHDGIRAAIRAGWTPPESEDEK